MASGIGAPSASARAAATSSAVRVAVPLGASTLSGWCSSTISTDSKYGAALAANRIISTAPMEKFGATSTRTSGRSASQLRGPASSRSSSKPVVPTTTSMPCRTQNSTFCMTAPGWVKSTATSAPASTSAPRIVADVDLRDQFQAAARPARRGRRLGPIRPAAPSTATFTTDRPRVAAVPLVIPGPLRRRKRLRSRR